MKKKKSLTRNANDKTEALAHCGCGHDHHHDHHHCTHACEHHHEHCSCGHDHHNHHRLAANESYLENMTEEEMAAYVNQLNSDMYDNMELTAADKEKTAMLFDEFMRHLLASAEDDDEDAIALLHEMQDQFHTILAQDFVADEDEREQYLDDIQEENVDSDSDETALDETARDIRSHLKSYVAQGLQESRGGASVINQSLADSDSYDDYDDEDDEDDYDFDDEDDYDFDDEDFGFLTLEATPGMISLVKLDGSKETELLAPYRKVEDDTTAESSKSKTKKERNVFTPEEKAELANSYDDTVSKARALAKKIKKNPKE